MPADSSNVIEGTCLLDGALAVISGYAGGTRETADDETVCKTRFSPFPDPRHQRGAR